jgi:hypothetical protein
MRAMTRSATSLRKIDETLEAMRGLTRHADLLAVSSVSAWSAAEHIDHSLKVASAFTTRIAGQKALHDLKGINLAGRIVLFAGWIPRGRGKAPEPMHGVRVEASSLAAAIDALKEQIAAIEPSLFEKPTLIAKHPYFGGLTAAQALRFVGVHNQHHLRIARDVLSTLRQT